MKTKLIPLLLVLLLTLVSCKETQITEISESNDKYKIVTPTQTEIEKIYDRMLPILAMHHSDYNCHSDNIYYDLFDFSLVDYVYPWYEDEVTKYIAEPLIHSSFGIPMWYVLVNENDPLGKFPKIPEEGYDENGNVDEDIIYNLRGYAYDELIVGHNKHSGAYIDWLVEGVWNGKIDHETFFEFEDGTLCYYHDGFYYTQEIANGGRGGGIMCDPVIESVTPIKDGKYEIKYTVESDAEEPWYSVTAVIAMKESQDGFRFWSIYSIDTEEIDS